MNAQAASSPIVDTPPQGTTKTKPVDDRVKRFEFTFAGRSGCIEFSRFGVCARGPWASHTGYRSLDHSNWLEEADEVLADRAERLAKEHYAVYAGYAFMVWEDGAEAHWQAISTNYKGQVEIRLPKWADGRVQAALEEFGFEMTDQWNQYMTISGDTPHDQILAVTKPLRAKGTRFQDEGVLAAQVRASIGNQLALF